jgi:cytochrome P450
VISINGQTEKQMNPDVVPPLGRMIGVDEQLLNELGNQYRQYRQAMSGPFDPVTVLSLTGKVLGAVNRLLASTEQTHGLSPTSPGRPLQ